MASSLHIGKVSSGSFTHNDRTQKVSYLIDDSSLNECSRSSYECIQEFQELKLQASENYSQRTKQKLQKSTIFLKEAIVNLQEHHTLKDLEPIKERLKSYGFTVLQMSIHRDEGFINPKNQKLKNYHAHITMFNLDVKSGKSVKFGKDYRAELSRLQTFTAKVLKMERGGVSVREHANELKVPVAKASRRLDTHDYKRAMRLKEQAEELQKDKNKKLEELMKKHIQDKKILVAGITKALTDEQLKQLEHLKPSEQFTRAEVMVEENIKALQNRADKAARAYHKQKPLIDTLQGDIIKYKQDIERLTIQLQEAEELLSDEFKKIVPETIQEPIQNSDLSL